MRAVAHSPKFAKKVGVPQSVGKEFDMAGKKAKKFGKGGWSGSNITIPLDPPKPYVDPHKGPGPTDEERAESEAQKRRLKGIRVTPKEGKIIDSANRSEGGGQAKGGKIVKKYAKGGVTKEMPSANQMGSMNMAKGGKVKKMATGGKVKDRPMGGTGPYNPLPSSKYASGGKVKKMSTGGPLGPRPPHPTDTPRPRPLAKGGAAKKMAGGGRAGTPTRPGFVPMPDTSIIPRRPMAKGGATKAGKAMVKKSADTEGRAMKFAKGGGIERKGKTNTKMVKMARGGKMKKGC